MTEDVTRIWRLPLPDDWEPEEYWCVSFSIPAGQQYVQALSAAIGLLTIAKTFDRDITGTGAKTVAATWERALYLAPMSVNENCTPVPVPPIPDEAAAKDAAAAVIIQFYQHIIHELNTCAPSPEYCGACVDDLFASLVPYGATEGVRGSLANLCTKLNEMTGPEREAYEADCLYVDQFESLSENIENNPYDWLNKLSDWLFAWLNETTDEIFDGLNTIGGLLGGNGIGSFLQDNGGIDPGGGAGFGGDCTWTHTFNGALGWGDWHILDGNPQYGQACGADWCNDTDGAEWSLILNHNSLSANFTLTHVSLTYVTPDGTPPFGQHRFMTGPFGGSLGNLFELPWGSHTNPVEWSGSQGVALMQFDMEQPNGYNVTLSEIVLQGLGIDPFA